MRYYFDGDSNLYGYGDGEAQPFSFPTKVKQMGAIDGRMKIYMEDYVYTYLYQYGKSANGAEKLAALVGRNMEVDGEQVIFICGAIQGKEAAQENGVLTFQPETWEYIGSQMEAYFKGMMLVGWVHCQPGFGSFLMAKDEAFHKAYFQEPWQVLFVVDILDKLDTFYIYNEEKNGLQQARGYFVYYEKNAEMQEYMLENSVVQPKTQKHPETVTEEPEQNKESQTKENRREKRRPTPEERMDAAQEIRRVLQRRAKEAEAAQKSRYAMLTGVSCVLCLVCVCMGYVLMSNMHRLQDLESTMAMVQSSYTDLAESVEGVKVQSAFAAQQQMQQTEKEQQEAVEETEAVSMRTHIVAEGETLGYISRKYYGDNSGVAKIMEANQLEDANLIYCGQELRIP